MLDWRVILIFVLIFPLFLRSEIEVVFLRWDAGTCPDGCTRLRSGLQNISQVIKLNFYPAQGEAELYWKPNEAFDFDKIDAVMHYIGLYILDIRLKVRGTIEHDDKYVYLRSIGDDTRFQLYSPIDTRTDIYVMEESLDTHVLRPQMRTQLLKAESNYETVEIEGTFFEWERFPLRKLIVEEVKFYKN